MREVITRKCGNTKGNNEITCGNMTAIFSRRDGEYYLCVGNDDETYIHKFSNEMFENHYYAKFLAARDCAEWHKIIRELMDWVVVRNNLYWTTVTKRGVQYTNNIRKVREYMDKHDCRGMSVSHKQPNIKLQMLYNKFALTNYDNIYDFWVSTH